MQQMLFFKNNIIRCVLLAIAITVYIPMCLASVITFDDINILYRQSRGTLDIPAYLDKYSEMSSTMSNIQHGYTTDQTLSFKGFYKDLKTRYDNEVSRETVVEELRKFADHPDHYLGFRMIAAQDIWRLSKDNLPLKTLISTPSDNLPLLFRLVIFYPLVASSPHEEEKNALKTIFAECLDLANDEEEFPIFGYFLITLGQYRIDELCEACLDKLAFYAKDFEKEKHLDALEYILDVYPQVPEGARQKLYKQLEAYFKDLNITEKKLANHIFIGIVNFDSHLTQLALESFKSAVTSPATPISTRLYIIDNLFPMEISEQLFLHAIGSTEKIAQQNDIPFHYRLKALGLLSRYGSQPIQDSAYNILKELLSPYAETNNLFEGSETIDRVKTLNYLHHFMLSSHIETQTLAEKTLLTQRGNSELSVRERIYADKALLNSHNREIQAKAYASLADYIDKTIGSEDEQTNALHTKALEAITAGLSEDDERRQTAIKRLIDIDLGDDSRSAYYAHKQLLKKLEEAVEHHLPFHDLKDGRPVTFNLESLRQAPEKLEIPHVTHKDLLSIINNLFVEMNRSPEIKVELEAQMQEIGQTNIEQAANSLYFQKLFGQLETATSTGSNGIIDPTPIKLAHCIKWLQSQSNVPDNGASSQAKGVLQFMINVLACPTGKDNGIEVFYNTTIKNIHDKDEDALADDRIQQFMDIKATEEARSLRSNIIDGDNKLTRILTGTQPGQHVVEAPHQRSYLYKLIGDEIGLKFQGELLKFDPNGGAVHQNLRNLSRQEVLDQFYQHYTPHGLIRHFANVINDDIKKGSKHPDNIRAFQAIRVLMPEKKDDPEYLLFDNDDIPLGITELGAAEMLIRLKKLILLKNNALITPQEINFVKE